MLACCTCTGELGMEGWQIWTDHPIREQYEVVMDLGEGAFAQVSCRMHARCSHRVCPKPQASPAVKHCPLPQGAGQTGPVCMQEPGIKQYGTPDGFWHKWLCLACKAWRVGFLCCLPPLARFVMPECSTASLVSPGRLLDLAATGELLSSLDFLQRGTTLCLLRRFRSQLN